MDISVEDTRIYDLVKKDLGNVDSLKRLKSDASIKQNLARPSKTRQPSVYLLALADGRKLKVTTVENSENVHFRRIVKAVSGIEQDEILPKIWKITPLAIYCEFIEGVFPDLKSDQFSQAYARVCARLHSTGISFVGKSDKLSEVDRMLRFLETRKKLKKSVSADLRGLFEGKLPERIRYSYTYADLTADNFVFDVAGELKLIDIGSLQEARLTDIFLFSHPTFSSISSEEFWDIYRANKGPADVADNIQVLRALGSLEFAEMALNSLTAISFLDWRKRRSRKARVNNLIQDLINLVK